jgi:DNA-binding HxlR family transcriptional regulator
MTSANVHADREGAQAEHHERGPRGLRARSVIVTPRSESVFNRLTVQCSRFDDFHASLGMARSVLTARLRKLTEQGVLERRAYSEHPPRYEYHLTDKGKALYPIMVSMVQWGDAWAQAPDGPPIVLVHDTCGKVTNPALTCPHCGTEVSAANAHSEPAPGRRTQSAPAIVSPA